MAARIPLSALGRSELFLILVGYIDVSVMTRRRTGWCLGSVIPVMLPLAFLGTPEHTSAQKPLVQDHVPAAVADSTPDATYLQHSVMSAVGSGAGVGAGFALAMATDDGAWGPTAAVTFGLVGSVVGSSALMALADQRLSLDRALGANAVGALGGLATVLMVEEAHSRLFDDGIVVVFSVGQGLVSAAILESLGY